MEMSCVLCLDLYVCVCVSFLWGTMFLTTKDVSQDIYCPLLAVLIFCSHSFFFFFFIYFLLPERSCSE